MSSNPEPDPWRVPGNNQPVEASNRTLNGDPAQSTITRSQRVTAISKERSKPPRPLSTERTNAALWASSVCRVTSGSVAAAGSLFGTRRLVSSRSITEAQSPQLNYRIR